MFIICKHTNTVNDKKMKKELINTVVAYLSEIIGDKNVVLKKRPVMDLIDAVLCINQIEFLCIVKNTVTTSNFGSVKCQLEKIQSKLNRPTLLILQSIYPKLLQELNQSGINCIDASGNCMIKMEGLIIHIEGKKKAYTKNDSAIISTKNRLFQEAGIKIIFRLLEDPAWANLSYRNMQDSAMVSIGSISIIMKELIKSGYILKTKNGKFLKNRKELLERWVIAYNDVLKPNLFIKRMSFKDKLVKNEWKNIQLPSGSYWGGEAAAHLHDGYLFPESYTLYGETSGALVKAGFRPDDNGEILVYKKFWTFIRTEKTTPILLTYADLMGSGNSRNIEAAQRLFNNELQYIEH